MKLAFCNEFFDGWKLEDVCKFLDGEMIEAIELAPHTFCKLVTDLEPGDRTRIRETIRAHNLDVVGIHWVLKDTRFQICSKDQGLREETANYLVELVRFTSDIGGKVIVFGSPANRSNPSYVADGWDWVQEVFTHAAREATDRGVTICIEPLRKVQTNFINTADQAVTFVRRFNEPSMKIILDCLAMTEEDEPHEQVIRAHAGWLAHFHLNDINEQGPGMAENTPIDFPAILRALKDIRYDGYMSVEVFDFSPGPEKIVRDSLFNLRLRHFAQGAGIYL